MSMCANGPTSLEVIKHIDGFMAENSSAWMETIKYYGIEKPMVLLSGNREYEFLENCYKKCILSKAQPDVLWQLDVKKRLPGDNKQTRYVIPAVDEKRNELYKKYSPLLKLIKNCKWVLDCGMLQMSEGISANCFECGDGSLVIPVVAESYVEAAEIVIHKTLLKGRNIVVLTDTEIKGSRTLDTSVKEKWFTINVGKIDGAAVIRCT